MILFLLKLSSKINSLSLSKPENLMAWNLYGPYLNVSTQIIMDVHANHICPMKSSIN